MKALMQANNSVELIEKKLESRTDIDELLLSLDKDATKYKYTEYKDWHEYASSDAEQNDPMAIERALEEAKRKVKKIEEDIVVYTETMIGLGRCSEPKSV